MKEKYFKENGILEALGLSRSGLGKHLKAGCPGRVPGKGFPLYAICKWIADRPQRRTDRTQARANAMRILDERDQAGASSSVGKKTPAKPRHNPVSPSSNGGPSGEPGLEGALTRIKTMEQRLHERVIETFDGGGNDTPVRLRAWNDSLDILRKMEADTLKVLEEKKRLMNVDAVRVWFCRKIETAKAFLLNLPGKIAPGLDGLPWHETQKRLEAEVRNALAKLATFDLT